MDMFPQASGGAAAAAQDPNDGQMGDLTDMIIKKDSYARNEAPGFPYTNLFIGDSRLGLKSDADEQLLLHIEFHEFVKLRSIKFIEFNNGMDPESNPSKVHLYVNRENLGFEDCGDVDPTQTLHLTSEDLKESSEPIALKFVRFQRVKTITLFIEDNQGGDITALGGLIFIGIPIHGTKMSEFKKTSNG